MSRMISPSPSSALVACNIYISAAASRPSHPATLIRLLRRAQDHCQRIGHDNHRLVTNNNNSITASSGKNNGLAPVAVVHAYADIPYDRTSFHLAGYSDFVSDVASQLIQNAFDDLEFDYFDKKIDSGNNDNNGRDAAKATRHPTVGLVDHVSVMPLLLPQPTLPTQNDKHLEDEQEISIQAAAKAAQDIGRNLSQSNSNSLEIFYYGRACPNNTPLSTVRRERTSFFNSGGIKISANDKDATKIDDTNTTIPKFGSATIGTPLHFVENFNVRLTSKCTQSMARSLTKILRGRNEGGIAGVEALTLPYISKDGESCYEVACNLTNPNEGSSSMILERIGEWVEMQKKELARESSFDEYGDSTLNVEYFVEEAYRVGTTEKQCRNVLLSMEDLKNHHENVMSGFCKIFKNS